MDANGNSRSTRAAGTVTYDRQESIGRGDGLYQYSYDPGNKRVWRGVWTSGTLTTDEVTFWSVSGQKLATYQLNVTQNVNPPVMYASQTGTNYYFRREADQECRRLYRGRPTRLNRAFLSVRPGEAVGYAERHRKVHRILQRCGNGAGLCGPAISRSWNGRFMTPDPFVAGSGPGDPGSWNRYAYVGGDPANRVDRLGQDWCDGNDWTDDCFIDGDTIEEPDPNLGLELAATIAQQVQSAFAAEATAYPGQIAGLEQSNILVNYRQGSDGTSNFTLSNGGFIGLAGNYFSVAYTSATAGTIAIGGQTIGWTVTGLGQFVLTGVNLLAGWILAQALEQPAGGKDELCYEQYQTDLEVCRALKSAQCYDQAAQRYAACLSGKPIPPFPYQMPRTPGRPPRRRLQ